MPEKPIPRWQQGFEPGPGFRDMWRSMTPERRRKDFLIDIRIIVIALIVFLGVLARTTSSVSEFAAHAWLMLRVPAALIVYLCFVNWMFFPKLGEPGED